MEMFSIIISVVFILLIIALVVTIFKYPRDIFIELPARILKVSAAQFFWYVQLITLPIWLPLWFLDRYFNWDRFDAKFFRHFENTRPNLNRQEGLPDIEYKETRRLNIQFSGYSKYFISSESDSFLLASCLSDGLESLGKGKANFTVSKIGNLSIARNNNIELYDFHYLIQWMDNELKGKKYYGFAVSLGFSFFGITDKGTLNNVIGKTSSEEVFSFNLGNGQEHHLSISDEIDFRSHYSTEFFEALIRKATP